MRRRWLLAALAPLAAVGCSPVCVLNARAQRHGSGLAPAREDALSFEQERTA